MENGQSRDDGSLPREKKKVLLVRTPRQPRKRSRPPRKERVWGKETRRKHGNTRQLMGEGEVEKENTQRKRAEKVFRLGEAAQ